MQASHRQRRKPPEKVEMSRRVRMSVVLLPGAFRALARASPQRRVLAVSPLQKRMWAIVSGFSMGYARCA